GGWALSLKSEGTTRLSGKYRDNITSFKVYVPNKWIMMCNYHSACFLLHTSLSVTRSKPYQFESFDIGGDCDSRFQDKIDSIIIYDGHPGDDVVEQYFELDEYCS